jgi:hypothetical protein
MSVASCIDTTADASEAGAGATTAAAATLPSVGGAAVGAAVGAAEHAVAPAARDTVLPGQMEHEVDAGAAEYMPIGLVEKQKREEPKRQGARVRNQSVSLSRQSRKLCVSHSKQRRRSPATHHLAHPPPPYTANVPAPHALHCVALPALTNPLAHATQADALADAYVPGAQNVHALCRAPLAAPVGHATHVCREPDETRPAAHPVHIVAPALDDTVPPEHALHESDAAE